MFNTPQYSSLYFSIHVHPSRGVLIWILKKYLLRNFWKILPETSVVKSFFSTFVGLSGSFSKSCLEQLSCRGPASACFCEKELHISCYIKMFSKSLKICKSEDCSMYIYNLLKRNPITELSLHGKFQKFSKDL